MSPYSGQLSWRQRIRASGAVTLLALLAVIATIGAIGPGGAEAPATVAKVYGNWAWVWTFGYLVGGITALVGVLRGDARFEGVGIILLLCAIFVNGLSIAVTFRISGIYTLVNFALILILLADRLWQLTHVTKVFGHGSS